MKKLCRIGSISLLLALGGAAEAAAAPLYVALGDSYTAGPLIPNQVGEPIDCARSDRNYPSLTAQALGLSLRDVSCSSATTEDMENPQTGLPAGGTNPPQFNGVTPDAELVTVGIGGNDAGLVGVGTMCAQLGVSAPTGTACRDFYTAGGRDRVKEKIDQAAPKVAAVLRGIHARAPNARVAIAGYPAVAPTDGRGCYPVVPLSPDDLAYINELLVKINVMIAEQAAANDAEYIDTYTPSIGHDVCTLPPNRWFEGLVPTEPAFPLHPNAQGEASMARSTVAQLLKPRPITPAPRVTALKQLRAAKRTGPPARFSFTLDRAALVTVQLQRRVANKRYGKATTFTIAPPVGGTYAFRLARKGLGRRPGAFKVTLTPAASGRIGTPIAFRFRMR